MPLVTPASSDAGILSLTFNQDNSCIAVATLHGIRIFSVDMHKILYTDNIGAVSVVEMLYCTSLMAFVGAGEQPALTPRKVTVMNTNNKESIHEKTFHSAVLAVKMNRKRLVVVLERKVHVYELESLIVEFKDLETPPNPKGVCALSAGVSPCYLALPSSGSTGMVRIYDMFVDGGNVLCEINAHKTPLEMLEFNQDSSLIATASQKGTLINLYSLPHAQKVFTLRRGSTPATIHSMAFSPMTIQPQLLAVAGSHGTVHVFQLGEGKPRRLVTAAASVAAGFLSAVTKYSLTDLVDPLRSIVAVSLPNQGIACKCAVILPSPSPLDSEQDNDQDEMQDTSPDKVLLVVATLDGFVYEYTITGLREADHPVASRTGECRLLGSRDSR